MNAYRLRRCRSWDKSMTMRLILTLFALCMSLPLHAEDEYEWQAEHVHSPLPLYTFEWDDAWPRSYTAPDIIAGCTSRVAFGDWQFQPNSDNEFGNPYWIRVSNYGMFHCAANLLVARAQGDLDDGEFMRGLFVRIGEGRAGGITWELWVLQEGFIPGSSYTLLARKKGVEGIIEEFTVLQRRCPQANIRKVSGMDIWSTRYCAIDSRAELLALSRRMLHEPPLGILARANEEVPDAETSDPSHSDPSN